MIELGRVSKRFGGAPPAVDDVSLSIPAGEFFSLLGPSGCGKTTTLRMIAGFEDPDAGTVGIDGEDVTFVPARRRAVHMVFQDYALFPHMTVAENVAFGLKLKRTDRAEVASRVREALDSMQLEGLEGRRPSQLSGGQRQRVALARALVNRPAALLLDEPLGALDLKLRKEMQLELKQIQERTATTFVYVTHDQEEALTMSDRIAVMSAGRVEQVGTPRELYERPATSFVANFIGVSNGIKLIVDRRQGGLVVMDVGGGSRIVAPDPGDGRSEIELTVRPEKITLDPVDTGEEGESRLRGRLLKLVYLGSMSQAIVAAETGETLTVNLLNSDEENRLAPGADVSLGWKVSSSFVIGSGEAAAQQSKTERTTV
ncbi:MAG: ABC transporter ATP-binding protein [Solirubrobacterales bacterium]